MKGKRRRAAPEGDDESSNADIDAGTEDGRSKADAAHDLAHDQGAEQPLGGADGAARKLTVSTCNRYPRPHDRGLRSARVEEASRPVAEDAAARLGERGML